MCVCLLLVMNVIGLGNYSPILLIFLMGLNISLGRKEHRLRGFFLIIPCIGIINGLAVPLFISVDLMHFSQREEVIYSMVLYGVVIGALLLFWLIGKKWQEKFDMEVGERHLRKGELLLLWIVGILMMCLSFIPSYAGMVIQAEESPEIGANILKEISEIPDIAIGARWHHERYDGRGYPDGKKGQDIPETAGIIGVADA